MKIKEIETWFSNNFCGCGQPEKAVCFLRELFSMFQENENNMIDSDRCKELEEKYNEGLVLYELYILTNMDFIEHGGSVYGSWLTPKGKLLREYFTIYSDEEIANKI